VISAYLPSAKLVTMAVSLALAGGLVTAAQYATKTPGSGALSAGPLQSASDPNWQKTLQEIQLESGITAPAPAPQQAVDELLTAAQSDNLTATIGRSLLVKLSSAGAEGLGTDIPTQEAIIAEAAAQVGAAVSPSYTSADVIKVPQTKESLYQYGNVLILALTSFPEADGAKVLYAFGEAVDYQDPAKLGPVRAARDAYRATAEALMRLPVPETLAPLHTAIANNLAIMSSAAGEMLAVFDDPLRGLGGLQVFQTGGDEAARLLTTIAGTLRNNGIIFNKDDPGDAWSAFIASP
jgi:hypothetical protein